MSPDPPRLDVSENIRAIASLEAQLKHFVTDFYRERDSAAQHRQSLREVVGAMGEAVRLLSGEMAEIKPVILEYRETRAEARGAAKLVRWMWALAVAVAGFAGALLGKKLS